MNSIVSIELAKYTLPTDIIKEVGPITKNHYNLNFRYEITRGNKKHYISIKEVEVIGQEKKHHTRLEVDTDLKPTQAKVIDVEKIKSEIEVLESWFIVHKFMKGTRLYDRNQNKLWKLKGQIQ